ncbi:MAG: 2,3-bisphosphoglycerate-independent phosphoglycerate mutase, partial [Chloroflexota bacterium]|nr:2,3-bisphosphoglycerate-independent phosphoglycerate mutase [Chloroflexota bacterium]
MTRRPVVLVIMDGWGCAPAGPGNAVHLAQTPTVDALTASCPSTQLLASEEAVG